ncbi:ABC transporter ATP-binding protein [Foetidibacter luteolus]|uniref:ABC transporter ATP-binding protein n=1 Tax=Foetidibacter luteolus TaxID=2608880 RepID=UPI00129BF01F|nr:ABC transporter ATP-binding protein [Foetidibacter luteolus]
MSEVVIKIESLSKQYRLGQVGRRTLSHDINRWWYKVLGKGDPYAKVGQENERSKKAESEYVWALRDICFNVRQGQVLGVIGRNGAGKSTLLKILSKVTAPTTGQIKLNGKIASLLEVGTGFHPELSGRDNIFLNGAILGMSRKEVQRKFDAIVSFSGVERYIDTPVKRYSSGMYVRLAFAVAAHLEPDILIVDEVLAVGDAEFQKKCLGKIKDVSEKDGRTVLFVSHNMSAVKALCDSCLVLKNGKTFFLGNSLEGVGYYESEVESIASSLFHEDIKQAPGNDLVKIVSFTVRPTKNNAITVRSGIEVEVVVYSFLENRNLDVTFDLKTGGDITVFHCGCVITSQKNSRKGSYKVSFTLPPFLLNVGMYYFSLIVGEDMRVALFKLGSFVGFKVLHESDGANHSALPGIISPRIEYQVEYGS